MNFCSIHNSIMWPAAGGRPAPGKIRIIAKRIRFEHSSDAIIVTVKQYILLNFNRILSIFPSNCTCNYHPLDNVTNNVGLVGELDVNKSVACSPDYKRESMIKTEEIQFVPLS